MIYCFKPNKPENATQDEQAKEEVAMSSDANAWNGRRGKTAFIKERKKKMYEKDGQGERQQGR